MLRVVVTMDDTTMIQLNKHDCCIIEQAKDIERLKVENKRLQGVIKEHMSDPIKHNIKPGMIPLYKNEVFGQ